MLNGREGLGGLDRHDEPAGFLLINNDFHAIVCSIARKSVTLYPIRKHTGVEKTFFRRTGIHTVTAPRDVFPSTFF